MRSTDDYLAALPADQRNALEVLRQRILAAVPGIEEHFGYGVPAFKYRGHPLVYMGASKRHCGLYGSVPQGFTDLLKGYAVTKGAIRFTPEKPLAASLVKALVKAKCAEIDVRWPARSSRPRR